MSPWELGGIVAGTVALFGAFIWAAQPQLEVRRRCMPEPDQAERRSEFVLECAQAANPMSDEEPEDMLRECQRIADRTFCNTKWAVRTHGGNWVWGTCADAIGEEREACREAGWRGD